MFIGSWVATPTDMSDRDKSPDLDNVYSTYDDQAHKFHDFMMMQEASPPPVPSRKLLENTECSSSENRVDEADTPACSLGKDETLTLALCSFNKDETPFCLDEMNDNIGKIIGNKRKSLTPGSTCMENAASKHEKPTRSSDPLPETETMLRRCKLPCGPGESNSLPLDC